MGTALRHPETFMTDEIAAPEAQAEPLTVEQAAEAVSEAPSEAVEPVDEPADEPEAPAAEESAARVQVEVTKAGDGLIYTGEYVGETHETFKAGDRFDVAESAAAIHEAKGLVTRV